MATTVNNAFAEFMKEKVNLDQEKTKTARSSRDNLIDNIKGFSGDTDFFAVYKDKILRFGSFERRTKIRPIDGHRFDVVLVGRRNTNIYTIGRCILYKW